MELFDDDVDHNMMIKEEFFFLFGEQFSRHHKPNPFLHTKKTRLKHANTI